MPTTDPSSCSSLEWQIRTDLIGYENRLLQKKRAYELDIITWSIGEIVLKLSLYFIKSNKMFYSSIDPINLNFTTIVYKKFIHKYVPITTIKKIMQ